MKTFSLIQCFPDKSQKRISECTTKTEAAATEYFRQIGIPLADNGYCKNENGESFVVAEVVNYPDLKVRGFLKIFL